MPPVTITNTRDQARIFPASAMAPRMLTELEGLVMEKITGPGVDAVVPLGFAASAILYVQAYVTASGLWAAVPNPLVGTDYSVVLSNASGVATLTEGLSADQSANTWVVWYRRDQADATPGNQSVAIAGDGV